MKRQAQDCIPHLIRPLPVWFKLWALLQTLDPLILLLHSVLIEFNLQSKFTLLSSLPDNEKSETANCSHRPLDLFLMQNYTQFPKVLFSTQLVQYIDG